MTAPYVTATIRDLRELRRTLNADADMLENCADVSEKAERWSDEAAERDEAEARIARVNKINETLKNLRELFG